MPGLVWAEKVALVIGNAAYTSVAPLDNPDNDATAVTAALRAQGFTVLARTNQSRVEMRNSLRTFRDMADGADVALVYYAGHWIEVAGTNFLVPVDARLEDERDAGLEMVEIDLVLRQISGARQLKMVVLDACRNNPFVVKMQRENKGRNVSSGLGRIEYAGADTLIAYAAAAGEITPDGVAGENSPFTRAFLNAMSGPPTDVRRLLGRVRDEMRLSVPGAAPFVYTSLGGNELVINPASRRPEPPAPVVAEPETPSAPTGSISADFVQIDRNGSYEDWNAFLIKYEGQSDHPLYAFALEKREALRADGASRAKVAALDPVTPDPTVPIAEAPAAVPEIAIVPRSRDQAARDLQTGLRERGCYSGAIDGILGRGSARGLRAFGDQIGQTLSVGRDDGAAQLDAVRAVLEDHPDTRCPVVSTVRKAAPKPTTSKPAQTVTKPAPEPATKTPTVDNGISRSDATKLVPYAPSDCIGRRKKYFDCD